MKEKRILFKKKEENLTGIILLLVTIFSAFIANQLFIQKTDVLMKSFAMTILMVLIVWFGIDVDEFRLINSKQKQKLFVISYVLSLCFFILSGKLAIYNLWMAGGIWIAAYLNVYLGMAVQFIFTYLVCSLNQCTIEKFLFYFIIGAVMCLLGKYCDKITTFIYVTIITVSCHIILLFVVNNFIFHDSVNVNAFFSVGTTVFVLYSTYFGFQHGKGKMNWLADEPVTKQTETGNKIILEKLNDDIILEDNSTSDDMYQRILSEDFELLKKLKERSPVLYQHSFKIAELSSDAARLIGCDQKVAKAGGLYHEIGKLKGKDYVEAGVLLAQEYNFPKEVIEVIKQHSSKIEKPQSKEAAIVMLTESVISTINYFEHEKKKALNDGRKLKEQPISKIISNIMDIRFAKGTLDQSGISISEFNELKTFYIESIQ